MKNSCPQSDSNPQPEDQKSDAQPTELAGLYWKLFYLNDLITYIYYENDEGERFLPSKYTVLCYLLEYISILYN